MKLSKTLRQTIAYTGRPTDQRGLLPIAVARKILAGAKAYPGANVHEARDASEKKPVERSHEIHAALVSLETPEEAVSHLTRLVWGIPLYDVTTLVERYGEAVLPWFAGVVEEGILKNKASFVEDALVKLGSETAFELVLKVRTIHDIDEPRTHGLGDIAALPDLPAKARIDIRVDNLVDAFIAKHPIVAARVLARKTAANPKDKRLQAIVKRLAATAKGKAAITKVMGEVPVEPISTKGILALLDKAAQDPAPQSWPKFASGIEDDPAGLEYHALRLVAARSRQGEGWTVVLERITGSFSPWEKTRIDRFAFGSEIETMKHTEHPIAFTLDRVPDHQNGETLETDLDGVTVRGPAGKAKLSNALVKKHDLKPGYGCEYEGDPGFNLRLRAYLALHPVAFWQPAKQVIELTDAEVLVDTAAFCHVVGATYKRPKPGVSWRGLPSKSPVYRSLAEALVKRKKQLFVTGEPNTDVRLHAVNKTAF